ncbi:hypothetical protein O6H91_18G017000 [Diphasiastrum complanatum]|uniref:Uncharacterized protein n=1 Tax=Diphasiastrum complanatum TaxID=34168 RepID=A0ACC2AZE0_DIPCM|nr:hypothetical protein O6H91_18G017000 [Diphasiastrum complanatum]
MAALFPLDSSSPAIPPTFNFSPAALNQAATLPACFLWPVSECPRPEHARFAEDDEVPTVDLAGFWQGDDEGIGIAVEKIQKACTGLGVFQIINHGVDLDVLKRVHNEASRLFNLPLDQKQRGARVSGDSFGFTNSFIGRYASNLPWKETLSLQITPSSNVETYLQKIYGDEDNHACSTFKKYGSDMEKLALELMELLALSLELPRDRLKKIFKKNFSILRANYFPPSKHNSQTLGIGPHTDPISLTILHQDNVPGLQIHKEDTWITVKPNVNAFVINIGDIFQVLSNDRYKSMEHRVVNSLHERKSFAYFFSPTFEALVVPLPEFVDLENPCRYKEFTWAQYLTFTQKHYRSDTNTLLAFQDYLALNDPPE